MGDLLVVLFTPRYLTALIALLALAAVGVLALVRHDGSHGGTLQGSGVAATQTRAVGPFEGVELAGSNMITVTVGGPRHVVVHADTNLLSHVTTSVHGRVLVIGNKPGSFATVTPMSVEVTVPSLTDLTIAGSGSIAVEGGSAQSLTVVIAGSGDIRARALTARDVSATISGSGSIAVTATRRLDATIAGSGTVMYAGRPAHVTSSVTGSGSIIPF